MVTVAPRTIVITTMPSKANSPMAVRLTNVIADLQDDDGMPRKRRRLTNLSPEERMLRRKLKNRVAAQTARDRKKARMDELEEIVAQLEDENKRLQVQNLSLHAQTSSLASENEQLRERLNLPLRVTTTTTTATTCGVSLLKQENEQNLESAALAGVPLQKELARSLCLWATHYTAWMLTLSLMYCIASLSKSKKTLQVKAALPRGPQLSPAALPPPLQAAPLQWWGPQQQSWNPSMN